MIRGLDHNVLKAELREIIDDVLPEGSDWEPARVMDRHRDRLADRLIEFVEAKVEEPAR